MGLEGTYQPQHVMPFDAYRYGRIHCMCLHVKPLLADTT